MRSFPRSARNAPSLMAACVLLSSPFTLHADIYGHNNGHHDKMWGVNFMPDLDQARSDFPIGGITGLPGDGAMYCYPTSIANIAAYTTWRGLGPWPASLNWTSSNPAIYNTATDHLAQIGQWMGTTATGGTHYPGGYDGARQLFDAAILFNVNHFMVSGSGLWTWSPKLEDIINYGLSGGLVQVCFGRYEWHWDDRVITEERVSGHCLTITRGSIDASGSEIRFRDPASGSPNTWSQSAFSTHTRQAVDNFVHRSGSDVWMTVIMPYDGFVDVNEKVQLIDSTVVVWPTWGLIDPPPAGGSLVIDTAPIDFGQATALAPVDPPTVPSMPGQPIDFTMRPDRQVIAYAFRVSPSLVALEARETFSNAAPFRLTFNGSVTLAYNRFMELGVATSTDLILYATDAGVITELARVPLPPGATASAMEYNDRVDEFWVLDAPAHRLHRFDRSLIPQRSLDILPLVNSDPLVPSTAAFSMAIDPRNGSLVVGSDAGVFAAHYIPTPDGRSLQADQVITAPAPNLHTTDLQYDSHGRLLIAANNALWEFSDTPNDTTLRPAPPIYSRLHPHRKFEITTSRSNERIPASELPGWQDLVVPGELDQGAVRDCPADSDASGSIESADFFLFLQAFFAAEPAADFNYDGAVSSADFFEFLSAFFTGCE